MLHNISKGIKVELYDLGTVEFIEEKNGLVTVKKENNEKEKLTQKEFEESMMASPCSICNAVETPEIVEGGIYIGLYEDINENRCHICQSEILHESTVLSEKQSEIYALKQQGKNTKDIADILGIERGTVKSHLHRIREKKRKARNTSEVLDR